MKTSIHTHPYIKAALLAVLVSLPTAAECFAQASNQNYIRTREYTSASGSTSQEKIVYYDGLGRPVETVERGITPQGADLVTYQEYDLMGRASNQWLPVRISGANQGAFVPLYTLRNSFAITYPGETAPYSKPVYEASPLNRTLEQYGPGQTWHNSGKRAATAYLTNVEGNDTLDCIHYWTYDSYGDLNDTVAVVYSPGRYATGALSVLRTTDEDGNPTWTFSNKPDHPMLIRQLVGGSFCDTYYVYDTQGNLGAVLPPPAADRMKEYNFWHNDADAFLREYAYLYLYDERNRCRAKRLPGCDWSYFLYDNSDQLIFAQDGEQRKRGEWTFTLPDAFNRPCVTGVCKNASGTSLPMAGTGSKTMKVARDNSTGVYKGYSFSGITLQSPQVLTVNYYDDYTFMPVCGLSEADYGYEAAEGYGSRYTESAKTKLTGTVTARLTKDGVATDYLYAVMYYDYKGRIVQQKGNNALGGKEQVSSAYNFSGQPTQVRKVHTAPGKEVQTEVYVYTYDHAGRALRTTHQLNGATPVILTDNAYDELGRLKADSRNGQAKLKTEYEYNIRSWTTAIAGTKFAQRLHYTDGTGTPRYNGNISSMTWKSGNETTERGYRFSYDELSRLKEAAYGEGTSLASGSNRFNEQITAYDKLGNILGLKRYGQTGASSYGLVDNLSLAYNANQLKAVTDNAVSSAYNNGFEFKDGAKQATEYVYDKNGNLTKDLNKKISDIQYNYLNLPAKIQFEDGSNVSYEYAADGAKVRTVHIIAGNTTTTDYCGNAIYENGVLKMLLNEAGYVSLPDKKMHFYLKDHQGNVRVVVDQDGTVEEVNHYYPFGGTFAGTASVQPYKYNGKELDKTNGLDWYDYGARQYDAAIGRWQAVDPMAEKYYGMSPYNYCGNEPVGRIDPNGMDWFEDEDGSLEYDPELKMKNKQRKLRKGQSYIGETYQQRDKKGNVLTNYRKDGSIMFKNETQAYDRMWTHANKVNREQFAVIGENSVLVLPEYKNDNTTSEVEEYGYRFENSKLIDPIAESKMSILGTIHTHQDGLGGQWGHIAPPGIDDDKYLKFRI